MIALDAMGGDYAPEATLQGAIYAAKKGIPLLIFGDQVQMISVLDRLYSQWETLPITLVHCSQMIDMEEEPTRGVLRKKDSSLVRAIESVVEGKAQAIVSAGNSGAALVGGTLLLGRADGISRPALGSFLPQTNASPLFCLDLGANVDCKPEHLEEFAYMGHAYVRKVLGIESPRIALLSNGEEAYKGSQLIKKSYDILLHSGLNFVGNLEARDVFDGKADVLVCDGFAGNVLIKSMQGAARAITQWLKQEQSRSVWYRGICMLASSIFKRLHEKMSYAQKKGGSLLLGLKHPLIVAHGCSCARAIEHAIELAHTTVQTQFIPSFNEELALAMHMRPTLGQTVKSLFRFK